jgi:glycosyltransferase involved in cell wall biosynthesis
VVASDAVGAAAGGLVRDGHNGLVVPEGDAAALAAALRRVVADRELAARLGAQARRDVREFDYRRMADAFERAVEYAIGAHARPYAAPI